MPYPGDDASNYARFQDVTAQVAAGRKSVERLDSPQTDFADASVSHTSPRLPHYQSPNWGTQVSDADPRSAFRRAGVSRELWPPSDDKSVRPSTAHLQGEQVRSEHLRILSSEQKQKQLAELAKMGTTIAERERRIAEERAKSQDQRAQVVVQAVADADASMHIKDTYTTLSAERIDNKPKMRTQALAPVVLHHTVEQVANMKDDMQNTAGNLAPSSIPPSTLLPTKVEGEDKHTQQEKALEEEILVKSEAQFTRAAKSTAAIPSPQNTAGNLAPSSVPPSTLLPTKQKALEEEILVKSEAQFTRAAKSTAAIPSTTKAEREEKQAAQKKEQEAARLQQAAVARAKAEAQARALLVQEAQAAAKAQEDALTRAKWLAATPLAQVGILYKKDVNGLRITGFQKGSSAEDSKLMIGDVIHTIDDELISGLAPFEAFMKCRGPVGSEVEIVASRMQNGFKTRIADVLVRDQNSPPLRAHLGLDFKQTISGMQITKLHPDTSAGQAELQVGDVISIISDEIVEDVFLAGMKYEEAAEKMAGPAGSSVELTVTRMNKGMKNKYTTLVTRDYKLSPVPVLKQAAASSNEPLKLSVPGHLQADVGIHYKPTTTGLQVTGFVKNSSAERSELKVGDVITIVGDEILLSGMPAQEAFFCMSGDGGTSVEIQAYRICEGRKQRILVDLERDVESPPKEGQIGILCKHATTGLLITKLVPGCSAADSDLQVGDIITSIDGELICGLGFAEASKKLEGPAFSTVDLGAWRKSNKTKMPVEVTIKRDFQLKQIDHFKKLKQERLMYSRSAPKKASQKPGKTTGGETSNFVLWILILLVILLAWSSLATYFALDYRSKWNSIGSISGQKRWLRVSNESYELEVIGALRNAVHVMSATVAKTSNVTDSKLEMLEWARGQAIALRGIKNATAKKSVRLGYNSTEAKFVDLAENLYDMSSAMTLGISSSQAATQVLEAIKSERDDLDSKGKKLAEENELLIAKVHALESALAAENVARTAAESELAKTRANLKLVQADSAELKVEKQGHSVEKQKRIVLERQLAAERKMFSEFDAILRKEQKVAAVAQQQSRIMAFLAPNPYITNNIFYPPSVHTPRPPTSARERSKVLQRMPKAPRAKTRSKFGRFAGAVTGLFRRRNQSINNPTSFFSVAITADIIEKSTSVAEVTLQTVEAIKIEVVLQRRELSAKDEEIEQAKRVLEQERMAAREAMRELEMRRFEERQESQERYAQLLHKHSAMQQANEAQSKQLEALKQGLDQSRYSPEGVEQRAASNETSRQAQAHEHVSVNISIHADTPEPAPTPLSSLNHQETQGQKQETNETGGAGSTNNSIHADTSESTPTDLSSLKHQETQGEEQETNETGKSKSMDSYTKLFGRKEIRKPE